MVFLENHGFTMRVQNHGKHGKLTMVYHGFSMVFLTCSKLKEQGISPWKTMVFNVLIERKNITMENHGFPWYS